MAEATVPSLDWLRQRLEEADPDLLRAMVETVVATLMGAEADALCGAADGAQQPERTIRSNGSRKRAWDTRLGTIPLQIPKLRQGSYFLDGLLEARWRLTGWTAFLRDLVARGLSGVRLVVSDDHNGLKHAIAAMLTGASWQHCRTHFARNLLTRVRRLAQPLVATLVRWSFAQPSAEEVWAHTAGWWNSSTIAAADDLLAFTAFPSEHWRQIWSNTPLARLHRDVRRRTDVVGIFP